MNRIVNFGSLNIDKVYQVEAFVRAGETRDSLSFNTHLGGKGFNQSVALARAGAKVYHAGNIGFDGDALRDYLTACGADVSLLRKREGATGHAIIQVDRTGDNCILIYGGANRLADREQAQSALSQFSHDDILLMQNETSALPELFDEALKRGIRVALNPSPLTSALKNLPLRRLSYLILNQVEAEGLTDKNTPEEALSSLRALCPQALLLLTLGKRGAILDDGAERVFQPAYPVNAVDTTGAGDTFTGYFLGAISDGSDKREALRLASMASAIAVSRPGAAQSIPTLTETRAALRAL